MGSFFQIALLEVIISGSFDMLCDGCPTKRYRNRTKPGFLPAITDEFMVIGALEKQPGSKLESAKGLVTVFSVEHAEHPSDN